MSTLRATAAAIALFVGLIAALVRVPTAPPTRTIENTAAIAAEQNAQPLVDAGRSAIAKKQKKLADKGPKSYDSPREAAEFFTQQRLAPGRTELPLDQLQQEFVRLRERQAAQALHRGANPGGISSWTWLGPGNIGGRTRAIVFDPVNHDIMYAAGVSGGIWKTLDAGANWAPLDDMMLNLAVTTLVIDPTDPNVIYAGTGEGWGSSSSFIRGLGIFKSTDAGATWNQLPGTVTGVPTGAFYYVQKLVISPNDHNRIYAATRYGVYRSTDAGATWSVVLANPNYTTGPVASNGCFVGCTDLVVRNDQNPDVLWAAFGSFQSDGLFRSDDGGDTWITYSTGADQGRMSLALAPSDNDTMYVLMADNGTGGATGQLVDVFRTTDGGASFQPRVNFATLTGPWLLSNLILATDCVPDQSTYSQGWYDNIIAVDPLDPDIVWVGGVDMFRSDDGGQNFGIAAYWIFYTQSPPPPYQLHPDHHTLVFHPDYNGTTNQILYSGNDGGIFRTANARAATSQEDCPLPGNDPYPQIVWERMNNNYGVTQFYHGDVAQEIDRFTGGCQDNGTNQNDAVSAPNSWTTVFGGDGGYVAIDPLNPDTIFVEIQFFPEIRKSTDGGQTFAYAINGITDTDGLFITPFAMDQQDPNVLWTGGSRPWRTTDSATLWELVGPNFANANQISAIGIAPSDSDVVYLGFNNGFVARTVNGLAASPSWVVRGFANGLPTGRWVSSVTVDPVDPDIAYATYSTYGTPHIYRTENGGLNWTSIDGAGDASVPDIPVHWLEVRPCNSDQLYVGTELGMFASDDYGATWQPANTGFANVVVEALAFRGDDRLVAFTHGRGAFMTDLTPCGLSGVEGDFDGDGDVDLSDFAQFSLCFGGANVPPAASCPPGVDADFDNDGDVDLGDFATFSLNFTGPL